MAAVYDQQAALQIILSPATGNVAHARQLRLLRSQDLVTGLPNRAGLLTRIEAAIAQAIDVRGESALVLARLQGFDDFLTLVGRSAANYVLVDTASLLRQSTPADALVAHCGDGEFAILISGPDNAPQTHALLMFRLWLCRLATACSNATSVSRTGRSILTCNCTSAAQTCFLGNTTIKNTLRKSARNLNQPLG